MERAGYELVVPWELEGWARETQGGQSHEIHDFRSVLARSTVLLSLVALRCQEARVN